MGGAKKKHAGSRRNSSCGKWTPAEDEILTHAVAVEREKNWKNIAERLNDKSYLQCLRRWQKVLNPELVKGPWKQSEDKLLVQLVKKFGPKDWSVIASHIHGRIGKQCRERWHNHLSPEVSKTSWTEEEDRLIIDAHRRLGNKWTLISKLLDGRPANAIKNHWNSTLKRKVEAMGQGKEHEQAEVKSKQKSEQGGSTNAHHSRPNYSSLIHHHSQHQHQHQHPHQHPHHHNNAVPNSSTNMHSTHNPMYGNNFGYAGQYHAGISSSSWDLPHSSSPASSPSSSPHMGIGGMGVSAVSLGHSAGPSYAAPYHIWDATPSVSLPSWDMTSQSISSTPIASASTSTPHNTWNIFPVTPTSTSAPSNVFFSSSAPSSPTSSPRDATDSLYNVDHSDFFPDLNDHHIIFYEPHAFSSLPGLDSIQLDSAF